MVSLGTAPVVAGLLGRLLGEPPPPRAWYAATALGLAGVVLLVDGGGHAAGAGAGVVLAATAGAAYGTYVVASRRLLDAGAPALGVVAAVFGCAAVLLLPLALLARPALGPGVAEPSRRWPTSRSARRSRRTCCSPVR